LIAEQEADRRAQQCLSKEIKIYLKAGEKHQQQFAKIGEEAGYWHLLAE
jgi:hypothetical protein